MCSSDLIGFGSVATGVTATFLAAFPDTWKESTALAPAIEWSVVLFSDLATTFAAAHRRVLDRARDREIGRIAITEIYQEAEITMLMKPLSTTDRAAYLIDLHRRIATVEGKHGGEFASEGNPPQ